MYSINLYNTYGAPIKKKSQNIKIMQMHRFKGCKVFLLSCGFKKNVADAGAMLYGGNDISEITNNDVKEVTTSRWRVLEVTDST